MREFAKIPPEFWMGSLNKKIKYCAAETKILAFYLMTCPNSNMLGIYYLPLLLASHETGTPLEVITRSIEVLRSINFCSYDEKTEYIWVHDMASSQLGSLKKNDNRVKHTNSLFKKLPNTSFLDDFYKKYADLLHLDSEHFALRRSPSEAIEMEIEKEIERENIPIIFSRENKKSTTTKNKITVDEKLVSTSIITKIDPPVFTIPLRQGKQHPITEAELETWGKNYPAVDVRQEIRHLIEWNKANPDRQKTQRGINRHIQGWLAHTQQNQNKGNRDSPRQAVSTWDHNVAVIRDVLEEEDGNKR